MNPNSCSSRKSRSSHSFLHQTCIAGMVSILPLSGTGNIAALLLPLVPVVALPVAARAVTVFDPANYRQNLLTAIRSLEQINNQITSLQNEAQMLTNQARNLQSLPLSTLQQLQQSVARTKQLMDEAQNIAFNVQAIDQAFSQYYSTASGDASSRQLIQDARTRWNNTVAGLNDAMRVQASVVGNMDTQRSTLSSLVGASQSATGALQVTQAGNQLLALQSQQLSDLTALVAANGRAAALQAAEQQAAAEQGREQRSRFLQPGTPYQPGQARMFYGN